MQTDNDPHWAKSRQQPATTTGVNIAVEEEEGKTTPHGTETVGWLAIEPGVGEWSGHLFEAGLTADAVTHSWYSFSFAAAPRFLAGLASYDSDESAHLRYRRAQVRVEEDSVFDSEYGHTTETAAYLAIEGSGELSAIGGPGGPASTTYYETQGGALAMRRAGYAADNGIFYILGDHLGSSSVILAQDGTVLKRDYYYPYGGNRGTPYTDITTKRFTGQYHEAGLPGGEGLSFYNARWYDPQLGRFVSADTLVPEPKNSQALNRYAYTLNNPLIHLDPTGHIPCDSKYLPGMDQNACFQDTKRNQGYYYYPQQGATASYIIGAGFGKLAIPPQLRYLDQSGFYDSVGRTAAGIIYEPIDWLLTARRVIRGEAGFLEVAVMVGFAALPGLQGGWADDALEVTGQLHHVFSNRIMRELSQHPTLQGLFQRDDVIVQALDLVGHKGCQTWHRAYDREVVEWLQKNSNATKDAFLDFLIEIYQRPDMSNRFPTAVEFLEALRVSSD